MYFCYFFVIHIDRKRYIQFWYQIQTNFHPNFSRGVTNYSTRIRSILNPFQFTVRGAFRISARGIRILCYKKYKNRYKKLQNRDIYVPFSPGGGLPPPPVYSQLTDAIQIKIPLLYVGDP